VDIHGVRAVQEAPHGGEAKVQAEGQHTHR